MDAIVSFFRNLFFPAPPTAEELKEREDKKIKKILWALVSLEQSGVDGSCPVEIYHQLKRQQQWISITDIRNLLGKAVLSGFVQRIGEEYPHYVLSSSGRNHVGLAG